MNISAIWENSLYALLGSTKAPETAKTQNQSSSNATYGINDSVTISEEGMALFRMPPPPHETDFENMSDQDLKDYLEKMQAMTGRNIPGMDNEVKASDLTDEQLQTVRQTLAKISEDMKNRQDAPPMQPPMPKAHLDSLSDDELVALLEDIRQKTGSLTELAASDDTDATALVEEQKQLDMDALMQMLQQYLLETALTAKMLYAEKAYSTAGQAVSI